MKNRKTVVVAFLLVAVMLLGVGYAALTDVLDINGSADVSQDAAQDAFDEDIYFEKVEVLTKAQNAEGRDLNVASISTGDPDQGNFTADGLKGEGDTAQFKFTIKNNSDLDAVVTPSLASDGNSNAEYFSITSDWNAKPKTIAAGATETYTVTVTLLKTPTTNAHGSFHIELTAVAG
jgi:cytochrome c oxidase assembly protein Cox11